MRIRKSFKLHYVICDASKQLYDFKWILEIADIQGEKQHFFLDGNPQTVIDMQKKKYNIC